ncbi:MAG TPA: hypothetical protein PLX85_05290 [Dehalococcoidia bacterium]|nr:hypothetical protein [Dehalococcoidia bacterium]
MDTNPRLIASLTKYSRDTLAVARQIAAIVPGGDSASLIGTGGGCEAFEVHVDGYGDSYAWVTVSGDPSVDFDNDSQATVCVYALDEDAYLDGRWLAIDCVPLHRVADTIVEATRRFAEAVKAGKPPVDAYANWPEWADETDALAAS